MYLSTNTTTIALPARAPLWLKLLLAGIAAAVIALGWTENRCQLNDPRLTDDVGFGITDERGAPITINRALAESRLTQTVTVQFWRSWPPIELEFDPLQ